MEKAAVIILCTAVFIYAASYFIKCEGDDYPDLIEARNLMRQLPREKKLIRINPGSTVSRHIDSYYVIDRGGYIPFLFSTSYMIVRYREQPSYDPVTGTMSARDLQDYDYVLVENANTFIEDVLKKFNFTLVDKANRYCVYKANSQ